MLRTPMKKPTTTVSDSLRRQILAMPKEAVDDLVTCTAAHAKALYALCLGLVGWSGAAYLPLWWFSVESKGWWITVMFPLCALPTVLLIALGVHLWAWMERRKFAEMRKGMYYVRWLYDPDQWARYCQVDLHSYRWLEAIFAACGAGMAMVVALMTHLEDGELWWGNPATHYGSALFWGVTPGYAAGWFVRRRVNQTERLRRRSTAQCLLGPRGAYITGQFWPWQAPGQRVVGLRLQKQPQWALVAAFRVSTQGGAHEKDVLFPVPPSRRRDAQALLELAKQGELRLTTD